jgi:hypothetical protein
MSKSSSVIAWMIARSGMDTDSIQPPSGGPESGGQISGLGR